MKGTSDRTILHQVQLHYLLCKTQVKINSNEIFQCFKCDAEQLTVIRKTKLSKIICQNSDKIRQLQGHILLLPNDRGNPVVRCAEISKMKLNAWKEHQQTNNSDHQSSHSEEEEEVWSSSYEEPDEENYQ